MSVVRITACENCGEQFEQKNKYRTVKTCSDKCRRELAARSTRESSGAWETKTCPGCGNKFQCRKCKPKTYCTWDCMMKARVEESRASRTCEVCGKKFTHFKRQDQRTCSANCRNKFTGAQREVHYPECRVCGISTGSYNRIYCDEHRPNRPGRKPIPRKVAMCKTCEQEFSRPGTWPGKMLYCSLGCSRKDPSYRRIKRYSFGNLNVEGGYELRFLACLQRLGISWELWPDDELVRYVTPDGKQRNYTPDFRIGDLAVEVKGWEENPDSAQRYAYEQWNREQRLVLVGRECLNKLERCFKRDDFLTMLTEEGVTKMKEVEEEVIKMKELSSVDIEHLEEVGRAGFEHENDYDHFLMYLYSYGKDWDGNKIVDYSELNPEVKFLAKEDGLTIREAVAPYVKVYLEDCQGSARRFRKSSHNHVKYLFKFNHEAGFEDDEIITEFCRATGASKAMVVSWSQNYYGIN